MTINRASLADWFMQIGIATLYVWFGYMVHIYMASHTVVSVFWPGSGLALAALLIGGKRYLWGVLLGMFTCNILTGTSLVWVLGASAAGMLEAWLGAWLLTRNRQFSLSLNTLSDYLRLIILGGGVASIAGATIGTLALMLTGFNISADYATSALHWWMGDTLGVALITPLLLAWWRTNPKSSGRKYRFEGWWVVTLTFVAGQIIFLGWFNEILAFQPKGFLMFLFITWVAIKYGIRPTTVVLNIVALQALTGAYLTLGYFSNDIAATGLVNYWFYMLILSGVGMALAAYVNGRNQSERSLAESQALIQTAQKAAGMGHYFTTPAAGTWSGDALLSTILGLDTSFPRSFSDWEQFIHPDDRQRVMHYFHDNISQQEQFGSIEYRITRPIDGVTRWIAAWGYNFYDAHGAPVQQVGVIQDVTERKETERAINHLAFYDPLTQLPNRRLLMDRLQQALASSARSGRSGALLFIDLDHFKTLNDTLGHDVGDLLLQQVASRLTSCIREGDTVARLGGDEFVVMLEDLSEHPIEAAAQTETISEKVIATLDAPYQLATHKYHNTPSIGATLFRGHTLSIDDLMKQADIAMYQAKKAGRNTLRFYDPQMQASITARVDMEHALRKALEHRQLQLYYQIQVDDTHRPLGAEVLIRWLHPEHGLIYPSQFIPLAEDTGLILPIGQWALETACAQLQAWQNNALTRHLKLSVNVSAKQFRQADFVAQVQATMQRFAINPTLLKLELTESTLLESIEDTITTMQSLRQLGVRFSLDDFGTGYSSLQYLKRLPLTQLKIDQSFIRDIVTDSSDKAIVRTIIAMAHSLNLDVIAEGVETENQRQFLLADDCKHFQGYLFGRPVPIEQFEMQLKPK